jgi:hypothetical protein
VIPDNALAEGVPPRVSRAGLTDEDRRAWAEYEATDLKRAGRERAK